jgi:hypothetical protein
MNSIMDLVLSNCQMSILSCCWFISDLFPGSTSYSSVTISDLTCQHSILFRVLTVAQPTTSCESR